MRNLRNLSILMMSLGLLAGFSYVSSADHSGAVARAAGVEQGIGEIAFTSKAGSEEVSARGGRGGGGGGGGSDCTPAASRIAYASEAGSGLFAVNPDGSCLVQLIDEPGIARLVWDYTEDDHIFISGLTGNGLSLLHVPDSADADSVSVVAGPWTTAGGSGGPMSAHADSGGILPALSQLMVTNEGADTSNVVVYTLDGSWSLQLTHYASDHQDGDGIYYRLRNVDWLAGSADHGRARIWYSIELTEYANGEPVAYEEQHRVISLDTTGWPHIGLQGSTDKLMVGSDHLIDGYPVTSLLEFSRDGLKAGGRGPFGHYMLIMDVGYDDISDEVTLHAASALQTASDTASLGHGVSFSPDNSTMLFNGAIYVGKGKKQTSVSSMFTTDTSAAGPSTSLGVGWDGVWQP